jgi:ABC-type Fe3+/spermidine/putrescine transport system ATPase subunit
MAAAGPSEATRGIRADAAAALHAEGVADVELLKVCRDFGPVRAVDDVSLSIRRGEFFSLLGPSGCGKTTILRMIGGFAAPTAGEIRIRGVKVDAMPPNLRPTNMVFQQLALFPHLNVYDNVAFGLRLKRLPKAEIRKRCGDALALVGLEELARRGIGQISGGQQQRVALARALVNEPAVLLLDEPFAALDVKLRLQMQGELKALQDRLGTTFVFVTHDQGEAFAMSDRIAVMNGGRVEQVGAPRDLYDRPQTRFVAAFVGDTNLVEGRIVAETAGLAQVDCGPFSIEAPASSRTVGETVSVSLRPEHLEIGPSPCAQGQGTAKVIAAIYQGPHTRLTLALDQLQLKALAPSTSLIDVKVGDRVAIGWRPGSACVIGR